jgi:hypothetical protein
MLDEWLTEEAKRLREEAESKPAGLSGSGLSDRRGKPRQTRSLASG